MIEAEKKIIMDKFDKFGEEMSDGRLTEPSDGKTYRLREAILLSKQIRNRFSINVVLNSGIKYHGYFKHKNLVLSVEIL